MPSIDISITLPSPLLDLTRTTPFPILIHLTLLHNCPITLPRRALDEFTQLHTFSGGLAFTDVSTGQTLQRSLMCVLSDWTPPTFSRRTQGAFVTLFPGRRVVLRGEFRPVLERPWFIGNAGRGLSERETRLLTPIPQWHGVREFDDGKTYQIGLSRPALSYNWLEGSKPQLLSWWSCLRAYFLGRVERTQAIQLRIVRPPRFAVRRPGDPGENERVDWPVFVRDLEEWCGGLEKV